MDEARNGAIGPRRVTDGPPNGGAQSGRPGRRSTPIRVCVVTPFGTVGGGAEAWLLDLLDHGLNPAHGFSVSAVTMADGPLVAALAERGCGTTVVPTGTSPAAIVRSVGPLSAAVGASAPDVVIANGVKAQLALALGRPRVRRPLIWVKHDHSFDRALARPLGRAATRVLATAEEVGRPTGRRDLVVIEPPRPPEPMEASAAAAELAARGMRDHGRLTLAMITRLVPYKGVDVAVEALADPAADDWQLVVIGGDDPSAVGESQRIAQLAVDRGVADRVQLLGPIPAAGRLLAAVDALAVMTRPDGPRTPGREGYGITATEAMLAGIPVITGGPGPIARRLATPAGPAGVALDGPHPQPLARALAELADPAVRLAMGAAGRAATQHLADAEQTAQAVTDVIRSAARTAR